MTNCNLYRVMFICLTICPRECWQTSETLPYEDSLTSSFHTQRCDSGIFKQVFDFLYYFLPSDFWHFFFLQTHIKTHKPIFHSSHLNCFTFEFDRSFSLNPFNNCYYFWLWKFGAFNFFFIVVLIPKFILAFYSFSLEIWLNHKILCSVKTNFLSSFFSRWDCQWMHSWQLGINLLSFVGNEGTQCVNLTMMNNHSGKIL